MGNCLQTKKAVSPSINITPSSNTSITYDKSTEPKTKQVSITFLKLLIDKMDDIDAIINLIDNSVFEISDIVESVSKHMGLSHDYELEMYLYGKTNIRVYFTSEQNNMLFKLVKLLMKYKKTSIIKRAQDECRELNDDEQLMLLM